MNNAKHSLPAIRPKLVAPLSAALCLVIAGCSGCSNTSERSSETSASTPTAAPQPVVVESQPGQPAPPASRSDQDSNDGFTMGASVPQPATAPPSRPVPADRESSAQYRGNAKSDNSIVRNAPSEHPIAERRRSQPSNQPQPTLGYDRIATSEPPVVGEAEAPFSDTRIVEPLPRADMLFKHYGVNPTIDAYTTPVSTFSMDVDTASWEISKAFLQRGELPPAAAVRVEEFVNAFDYHYQNPSNAPFALQAEAYPSPFRPGYHVLHLAAQARDIAPSARKPANLVFVVDVSGSMNQGNRLGIVKSSLTQLLNQLDHNDYVSIVAYNQKAKTILKPTRASDRRRVLRSLNKLKAGGSTNVQAGLRLGYKLAAKQFQNGLINRVVLCSDGVANVGSNNAQTILAHTRKQAAKGVKLTTVGVGMGNYNDVLLEQLAQHGDGQYTYVNSAAQAERFFVDKMISTLEVVAKDAKIQVQFDPRVVRRYRLLGYENRAMADRDFLNERADAAEIGAGHSVTAIYEVQFVHRQPRYDFGRFKISYKHALGERLHVIDKPLPSTIVRSHLQQASSPAKLALAVASFAEKLRGAYWSRAYSYGQISQLLAQLESHWQQQNGSSELQSLIHTAERLDQRGDQYAHLGSMPKLGFDRVPVLR